MVSPHQRRRRLGEALPLRAVDSLVGRQMHIGRARRQLQLALAVQAGAALGLERRRAVAERQRRPAPGVGEQGLERRGARLSHRREDPAPLRQDLEIRLARHLHLELGGAIPAPDDMRMRVHEARHDDPAAGGPPASVDATEWRAEAAALVADEAFARGGPLGPLHGLPIAHKDLALTASIGVISEFLQLHDALTKLGIDVKTIKAGKLKDAGSPVRKMNDDDERYFQSLMDDVHKQFIEAVGESLRPGEPGQCRGAFFRPAAYRCRRRHPQPGLAAYRRQQQHFL